MIKKRKMNTIVNITGLTLKCLETGEENDIKKAKIKEYKRKHYILNKEKYLKSMSEWYLKNKENRKIYRIEWYKKNKELVLKRSKQYYENNKEKRINYQKIWKIKNRDLITKRERKKRQTNPTYKLLNNLRRRILLALKGNKKSTNTLILLGVPNLEFLWNHLESTFKPGMTRENHGLWHIDHIRPCSSFDLSKSEEQVKCFHYTNLQALWAHENLSKSNKFVA